MPRSKPALCRLTAERLIQHHLKVEISLTSSPRIMLSSRLIQPLPGKVAVAVGATDVSMSLSFSIDGALADIAVLSSF